MEEKKSCFGQSFVEKWPLFGEKKGEVGGLGPKFFLEKNIQIQGFLSIPNCFFYVVYVARNFTSTDSIGTWLVRTTPLLFQTLCSSLEIGKMVIHAAHEYLLNDTHSPGHSESWLQSSCCSFHRCMIGG